MAVLVSGPVPEYIGAQVTYSCDTHLVLVGETLATCSLPSLTWLPSSDDVTCVQPPVLTSSSTVTSQTPVVTLTMKPMNGDKGGSSLSTAEAVATTAVVCVVCSFTAGLLLGVMVTVIGRAREARLRYLLFMRTFPWRRHLPLNSIPIKLMDISQDDCHVNT
ncbi:hypothetical protein GBAR_LOCUS24348, partial [Geodia barretti]